MTEGIQPSDAKGRAWQQYIIAEREFAALRLRQGTKAKGEQSHSKDSDHESEYQHARSNFLVQQDTVLREVPSASLVPLLRLSLTNSTERMAAIRIVGLLGVEERKELLVDLLALACYTHGLTGEARNLVLSLPRDWLLAHIEGAAMPLIQHQDYEEYRGLLEIYSRLDQQLALRLARRAAADPDLDIREAGEEFIGLLEHDSLGI